MEEQKNVIDEPLKDLVYEPKLEDFDVLDDNEDTSLGSIRTFPMTLGVVPLVLKTS